MGTGSKWGRTLMLGLYHFSIAHINVVTSTNFVADGKGDLHHLCLASYRFPDGHMPKAEQVSNLRHSQKQPSDSSNDELLTVMSQCKSKDVTAHFIRDVKAGPDPALVIATDQHDLVKFCTSPDEFTVITVDQVSA